MVARPYMCLHSRQERLLVSQQFQLLQCRILLYFRILLQCDQQSLSINQQITSSMELGPSWEATSYAAAQEFPNISWNLKVRYLFSWQSATSPYLSQINLLHITPSCFPKIHFNIILPPPCSLPSGLFHSAFPQKSCMHWSSPHACYIPCLSHPPWLDHSNYIWWRVLKLLILQPAVILSLFSPKILRNLFSVQRLINKQAKRQHKYSRDLSNNEMH
jgi:hypothetical protein